MCRTDNAPRETFVFKLIGERCIRVAVRLTCAVTSERTAHVMAESARRATKEGKGIEWNVSIHFNALLSNKPTEVSLIENGISFLARQTRALTTNQIGIHDAAHLLRDSSSLFFALPKRIAIEITNVNKPIEIPVDRDYCIREPPKTNCDI